MKMPLRQVTSPPEIWSLLTRDKTATDADVRATVDDIRAGTFFLVIDASGRLWLSTQPLGRD